jgi:hypothetical protein
MPNARKASIAAIRANAAFQEQMTTIHADLDAVAE